MKGRVLLVDDDPAILKYCARLLAYESYAVTSCSSAAGAAAAINSGARYDVLLTDFYLGDGFGSELITLMKNSDPSAKTLLMTGDESLAGTRGPGPDYADGETLIKPFLMEDLVSRVARLMAGNAVTEKRTKRTARLDKQ